MNNRERVLYVRSFSGSVVGWMAVFYVMLALEILATTARSPLGFVAESYSSLQLFLRSLAMLISTVIHAHVEAFWSQVPCLRDVWRCPWRPRTQDPTFIFESRSSNPSNLEF